jgi:asparagine synthetase B (glutamine-hydrolysing)
MRITFKTNIKKIDINNDILNIEFYGNIYHSKETFKLLVQVKNKDELIEVAKKIPGVWFIKAKINNETILISDIVGGLRVYYTIKDNKLYLFTVFSEKPYKKIEIHKEEELFWKRHSYTTGIGTLDKRVYKFPPASYIILTNNEVVEKLDYRKFNIYLDDIDNTPNDKKLKDNIFSDLEETIKALKGKTVLLAWSGGLDSNLLVILLKEYKIDFIPYYLSFYPKDNDFLSDDYKVEKMSKILGIEPFMINIDLKTLDIDSKIIKDNLNDKHWGFYLFGDLPVRKMLQSYNLKKEDIVILSGQSSDSIFTWGVRWKAFGGVLQRYLIIKFLEKSLITKKLMAKIYTYLFDNLL